MSSSGLTRGSRHNGILEFPSKFTINFLKYFERFIVNLFFTYYIKKALRFFSYFLRSLGCASCEHKKEQKAEPLKRL